MVEYDKNVDYGFLEAMGIKYTFYQPWQMGLFHEEIKGKFIWYPKSGTLMAELKNHYAFKVGEYDETEEMYNAMMDIVTKQLTK